MKPFKISIILPVYNVEKYLESCLTSLLSQTLENIEIVAVNDGSTDSSLKLLEAFQREYPQQLFIYTTANHGVSHARNYGFSKARGEYVWFVDSDDFVEPDACEKLYSKAVRDNNDLVLFSYYNVNAATGEKKPFPISHYNQNFRLADKPYEMSIISPYPWIKFIKYELFEGLAFPEGIRFEDLPVAYLLAAKAQSVGVVRECLYNYRKNVGFLNSLTPSTLDIKKAVLYLNEKMSALGFAEQYRTELDFIAIRHFFFRFWKLLTNYETGKKELKLSLIQELYDYIDEKIPDWRANHYVQYTLPGHLSRMLYLYGSRTELTAFVEACDGMEPESQKRWIKKYKAQKEKKVPAAPARMLCGGASSPLMWCTESLYPLENSSHRTCFGDAGRWQRRMLTAELLVFPDGLTRRNYLQGAHLEGICQTPYITLDSWEGSDAGAPLPAKADAEALSARCPAALYPRPERNQAIRQSLGIPADTQLFLCCPLLPGKDPQEAFQVYRSFLSSLYQLDCELGEGQLLYLSPCEGETIDCSAFRHIRLLPEGYEVYDFANACDAFLSDYHPGMVFLAGKEKPVLRFLCNGEEYIENPALRRTLAAAGVRTCTNVPALAALLNSPPEPGRFQKPEADSCAKDSSSGAPDASRTRVLYYSGRKLSRRFAEELSALVLAHPEKEYWLALPGQADASKYLRFLTPACRLLTLETDVPKGSAWKAAGFLISRLGLSGLYPAGHVLSLGKAAYAQLVGKAAFDEVIIASTENLQTIAALLHAAPSAVCITDTFSQEKYETTRSYRNQIRFLRRLLKAAGAEVAGLPPA